MAVAAPVSSSFCVPHETELVIKHESWRSRRHFAIKDRQGAPLFSMKSEGGWFSQTERRLYDATSGNVVLLLLEDTKWFGRSTWSAFQGASESASQLLFTVRRKGIFSSTFEVFLRQSSDSSTPDFSIKQKSWGSRRFNILSNGRPVAEAKPPSWGSSGYVITVYPEMDRAFVVALAIIWIIVKQRNANGAAAATPAG